MDKVIILPTYNEKENLAGIVNEIFKQGVAGLRIIVVDDNSPDGTGRLADELASQEKRLTVLHRPVKEGLGRAYIAGFRQALADPDCRLIFEMDADWSHQPKYLPELIRAAEHYDLVLGSRYILGGGVENWGWLRRQISQLANRLARWILKVDLKDLTGGFKCFHRQVLEAIDFSRVESAGYNFQIEITYKALKLGFKIGEVPIKFVERRSGKSKFSLLIMLESFIKVIKLRKSV